MPLLSTRIKHEWDWRRRFTVRMYPSNPSNLYNESDYKYSLEDHPEWPGHQFDPVLKAIINLIKDLSSDHLVVAAAKIRVWPLTDSPPLWPPSPRNWDCPVKMYAFKEYYQEFPITMPICLGDRGGRFNADSLLVRCKGEWKPLRQWLLDYPDPKVFFVSAKRRLLSMRTWWDRNGKTFPIMELPPEVRMILFQHIMGSVIYPSAQNVQGQQHVTLRLSEVEASHCQVYEPDFLQHLGREENDHFTSFGPTPPNIKILELGGQIGEQIRQEALRAAWVGSRKHFSDPDIFSTVMTATPPPGRNWLTRIELHMSFADYF